MTKHTTTGAPYRHIVASDGFRQLQRAKLRFIVPATVFFLVYYFALPVLTGYWPQLMGQKVLGGFSLSYLFALSQFPMAWMIAGLYLRAAARFDRQAAGILSAAGLADGKEPAE
jgi:uncharacterized membrane protein (DUF485 family)